MEKIISINGQDVKLATITVGALEQVEVAGKTARPFNIALVAASILGAGDNERGTEAWVRSLQAFAPEGVKPDFKKAVDAANLVNYFETQEQQDATDLSIQKIREAAKKGQAAPKGENEPAAPAGA